MFTAQDVKSLREKTGAGMMDCKKALEETKGNMDDAITWLREKGISKAAKKAERIAAEGLTLAASIDNYAVIVEVNSETDFVAKNEEFKNFVHQLVKTLLGKDVKSMEEALSLNLEGTTETVNEAIINLTAKIGEKISFRRFETITKENNQNFGIYSHMGGKITSVVVIENGDKDIAKNVAMHAAAMRPQYLNETSVPENVLEKEKEIMTEQLRNEGKPQDKINQIYIKAEHKESVGKYLTNNNSKLISMVRYEVGEGMEKRNDNFAEEVQNQING